MTMLCRQCEQTAQGKACTVQGVCGKNPDTAALQDALLQGLKGVGYYAHKARLLGVKDADADRYVIEGLFTTVTNVNFDPEQLKAIILKSPAIREKVKNLFLDAYKKKNGKDYSETIPASASWMPAQTLSALVEQGSKAGIVSKTVDETRQSLREVLLYGLKGMAAYADHAAILGSQNEAVNAFFHKALAALEDDSLSVDALIALNMEFGKVHLQCLEILDKAHTTHFGNPVPTAVSLTVQKGPAIIVSGHDLNDLEQILQQTEGKGISVYTHGEMLPAHGYPQLKRYKHLAGHYGTAWQNQQKEFDKVPAAIIMTTNCIQQPRDSYTDRIFTTGLVAWPGVEHIPTDRNGAKDFSVAIKKALDLRGFPEEKIGKNITVGFGHNAVLGVADTVIQAVKSGAIKHFFLIGGCDGAKPGRNYYTEFAQKVPKDCVILTLACGKFRFNTLDFGTIGGIPRLLDCGQCNDAYSAIAIASALAKAFNCGVNDLPLSLILSWYEQKAVAILLTLLSLGIKNIRLGPTLPAFITPTVLKVLVDTFQIKPISTPDEDLKAILAKRG